MRTILQRRRIADRGAKSLSVFVNMSAVYKSNNQQSEIENRQCFSFPLDCGGGLGTDVVDDAVNTADFVDDPVGQAGKQVMG